LDFFAAERAPHAETLYGHLVARQAQNASHNLLRLAGMLRGRMQRYAAGFRDPRDGALGFQIEVLLAADGQLAREYQWAALDAGNVAAGETRGAGQETAAFDGVGNGQNRGPDFIFDLDPLGAEARGFERFTQHPGHRLPVKHDLARKQRFVMPRGAAVANARNVGGGKRVDDPRH
jgi:hypothetical protein